MLLPRRAVGAASARRTAPLLAISILLAIAQLGAGRAAADPGQAYAVDRFAVEYAAGLVEGADLPPVATYVPFAVELAELPSGLAAPEDATAGEPTRQVEIGSGTDAGTYHASAIAAITRALLARVQEQGLVGVLVRPHGEDIDVHSEADLRLDRSGSVRLVISIGRVSELRTVAAGDRVAEEWRVDNPAHREIRERSPIQPSSQVSEGTSDVIRKDVLEDYLFRVNRYPGRRVEAVLAGARDGEGIALDLRVHEAKPWFLYAQTSDTGSERTDVWQHRIGAVHRQLTGNDDTLSIGYTNAGLDAVNALDVAYEAPWFSSERPSWLRSRADDESLGRFFPRDWVPWWGSDDLRWRLAASWSDTKSVDVGGVDDISSTEWSTDGRLVWQAFQYRNLFADLFAGVGMRSIDVMNRSVTTEASELFVLPRVGLELERIDETSTARASVDFETNVSKTFGEDLPNLGRKDAEGRWKVLHFDAGLSQYLEPLLFPEEWKDPSTPSTSTLSHEVSLGVRGQYAFGDRLIAQASQVAGGLFSVRGYEQSVASGDDVVIASGEYRFHLPRALPIQREPLRVPFVGDFRAAPQMVYGRPDWDLVLKAFVDYGRTKRNREPSNVNSIDTLLGVGLGVELQIKSNFTARAEWGHALRDAGSDNTAVRAGNDEFHFLFSVLY